MQSIDITTPDILEASAPPAELPGMPVKDPQRNVLKFNERTKLSLWLNTDDMRARAAKESDATLATEATQALGFDVTAANIASMRVNLGITKAKPEKPASTEENWLDTLQKKVAAQGIEIEHLKVHAQGTDKLIATLRAHLHHIETVAVLPVPENLSEWPISIQPPAPTAATANAA